MRHIQSQKGFSSNGNKGSTCWNLWSINVESQQLICRSLGMEAEENVQLGLLLRPLFKWICGIANKVYLSRYLMASKGAPLKQSSGSIKGSAKVAKPPSAKERLSATEVEELRAVFDLFDEDHGGTIDPSEIQKVLSELGLDKRNPVVFQMITDLQEQNRPLTFDEFLDIISNRVGDVKSKEGLQKLFNLYDTDGSGFIDFEKFKHVAKELGESMNDDEILEMMHHVHVLNQTETNEYIDFNDFYRIVTKKKY